MAREVFWTRQHKNILDDIKEYGEYKVKERYIRRKLGDIAKFYLDIYKWYRHKASKIVEIPDDAKYPIWLSTEEDMKLPLAGDQVMLELIIPEEKVIKIDMVKWDYVVNYWYIPKNKEDAQEHKKTLEKYGIKSESNIYMNDFYPLLKEKIVNSWDRLFDNNIKFSEKEVATIWEIKEDWINEVEFTESKKRGEKNE